MKRLQFLATIMLLMGMVACGDDAPKKKSKVEKDNQTEEVQQQVEEVKATAKIKCVDDLLRSGQTWEIK